MNSPLHPHSTCPYLIVSESKECRHTIYQDARASSVSCVSTSPMRQHNMPYDLPCCRQTVHMLHCGLTQQATPRWRGGVRDTSSKPRFPRPGLSGVRCREGPCILVACWVFKDPWLRLQKEFRCPPSPQTRSAPRRHWPQSRA